MQEDRLTHHKFSTEQLEETARNLRKTILEMIHRAGSGHPGGSLSICEILSVLYYRVLRIDSRNPHDPDRDRFILSKGHAAPALYAVLAKKGFFPESELNTLRQFGSRLQGHPDMRKVPGVEISSGSLGMGISFGVGTALAARLNKRSYRTYVMTGCGELDEGQNWEALLTGSKYKLDNLTVIVDYNKVQLDGSNDEILPLCDLRKKLEAFCWKVIECDGHDVKALIEALEEAGRTQNRPTVLIAHTVKGKGVSFMENRHEWHGKAPDRDALHKAMSELKGEKS
jgi:transketolase